MSWLRTILHIDMDAFFASVEALDHPALAGLPLLVGHAGKRGVVAAASYAARKFGCRSAMPMAVALRLCPHAVVLPGRHERYAEISRQVFAIFERYTPQIEPLSIDEAFLDVTGVERLHGTGEKIGGEIKAAVREEVGLTCSVGVAPNKFLAKLASDLRKPDALVLFGEAEIASLLPTLPVDKIYGIGPKTVERLAASGIRTVGDLRHMPADWVAGRLGSSGEFLQRLAWGLDDRPVCRDGEAKSIGHEETFEEDVGDPAAVREVLLRQVEAVAARLRRHGLAARRVGLKIRFGEFVTISRSRTLPAPTDQTDALWAVARGVFEAWAKEDFRPVRLIGMHAEGLGEESGQLELFADPEKEKRNKLDAAVDAINRKFGARLIQRGGS